MLWSSSSSSSIGSSDSSVAGFSPPPALTAATHAFLESFPFSRETGEEGGEGGVTVTPLKQVQEKRVLPSSETPAAALLQQPRLHLLVSAVHHPGCSFQLDEL